LSTDGIFTKTQKQTKQKQTFIGFKIKNKKKDDGGYVTINPPPKNSLEVSIRILAEPGAFALYPSCPRQPEIMLPATTSGGHEL